LDFLPIPGELTFGVSQIANRFGHLASIETYADGALEIVDESKYLLVPRRPSEVAGFIRDIAIQRRSRKVAIVQPPYP